MPGSRTTSARTPATRRLAPTRRNTRTSRTAVHNITATSNVRADEEQENARVRIVGRDELIQIAGAGPAGLAAATAPARAGRRAVVHEAQAEGGYPLPRP